MLKRLALAFVVITFVCTEGSYAQSAPTKRSRAEQPSGMLPKRVAGEPAPFVLNGEPFFSIGLWGHAGCPNKQPCHELMDDLAAWGFNRIDIYVSPKKDPKIYLPYLDAAREHGLAVRFMIQTFRGAMQKKQDPKTGKPLKDPETGKVVEELLRAWPTLKPELERFVRTVHRHEALFGYSTEDEAYWNRTDGRPYPSREDYADLNNTIAQIDPDHRVVANFAPWEQVKHRCTLEGYRAWTSMASSFTMDVYPLAFPHYENTTKLNAVAEGFLKLKEIANDDSIPLGMILQACAWSEMGGDAAWQKWPMPAQTRFMVYDIITLGAKNIEWYGAHKNTNPKAWQGVKRCAKELAILQDILADGKTLDASEYVVSESLHAICKQYPAHTGPKYLIVTHPSEEAQKDVPITIKHFSGDVRVLFEDRTLSVDQERFKDDFDSWGVHVYTTDTCDLRPPKPRNARVVGSSMVEQGDSVTLKASGITGSVIHWYKDDGWELVHKGDTYTFSAPQQPGTYTYHAFAVATERENCFSWVGDRVTVTVTEPH